MESLGHCTSLSHYLLLPWLGILLLSFQTMVQLKNKDATNQSIYWFSLLVLTTATTISTMSPCKFAFSQIMSSPSFHISFHSWIKMNLTNWPAPDLWVFIAQLVDHCSANDNCNDHTIFTDFRSCNNEPLNDHLDCFNCILRQDL